MFDKHRRVSSTPRLRIDLRLDTPRDMFELPHTDLFAEHRNFLTGVDICISELRSRFSRRPVQLAIALPPDELTPDLPARFTATLRRYCEHRIRYSTREIRALRIGGISALRIGVPLAATGLAISWFANRGVSYDEPEVVTDHLGWVLGWVGLWYPLDQFLFYPLAYGRERRALERLRDAEVIFDAIPTSALTPVTGS
jgi:hypothetical protein